MKLKHLPKTNPVSFRGAWWFLSNMSLYPVLDYPSAENAYQASKCANIKDREQFKLKTCSPKQAKYIGMRVNLKPNFNEQRIDIMRKVLEIKFRNRDLALMLIGITGEIVERNTWHDNFWGVCNCSKCLSSGKTANAQNNLGKLLMELRTRLNQDETLRQTHSTFMKQHIEMKPCIDHIDNGLFTPFTISNDERQANESYEYLQGLTEREYPELENNKTEYITYVEEIKTELKREHFFSEQGFREAQKKHGGKYAITRVTRQKPKPKPEPTEDLSHKTRILEGV